MLELFFNTMFLFFLATGHIYIASIFIFLNIVINIYRMYIIKRRSKMINEATSMTCRSLIERDMRLLERKINEKVSFYEAQKIYSKVRLQIDERKPVLLEEDKNYLYDKFKTLKTGLLELELKK